MTTTMEPIHAEGATAAADELRKPIEKVSIIISKGSLDGVYPGLIMVNGARMDGIEVEAALFTRFAPSAGGASALA